MLSADDKGGLSRFLPAHLYEAAEFAYSARAFQRLAAAAKACEPDILYERYNLFFHSGVWVKRKLGLPLILEVNAPLAQEREKHGGLAWKSFAAKSEAAIWRAADKVLPVTNALAEHVRAAGVSEDRIDVIQNGVGDEFLKDHDPSSIRQRYNLSGKLVLGFTGFVRDWHGMDGVIRYLAATGNEALHLLLVGDGPARGTLEYLARELNVSQQVTFTGVVQREEIPVHVAAFDIALQPAVVDYASPLKLFEYMALGKAIIAPNRPNIREVLTDGGDGLLFGDGAFEQTLARAIEGHELRARVGAAAKETLLARDYTWAGNARRVEAIAERLRSASP